MEEALVRRHGIEYRGIRTGQLRGINPLRALFNIGKMIGGFRQTLAILDSFRPDICLATGGYVCAPVVAACRLRKIPVLIYLPDMTPGWAIRILSRLAARVAVSSPEAAKHFGGEWPQGKAVVTGYPVRQELAQAAQDRKAARLRLAQHLRRGDIATHHGQATEWQSRFLADDLPLLLVWGASQGARSINRATWAALETLLPHAYILHIVGTRDWPMALDPAENPARRAATGDEAQKALWSRYCGVDYLHEAMVDALAAADLTVARSGASILGEFTVTGLPAVLVPLPIAGGHQHHNAAPLAQAGAAVILEDHELHARLTATVEPLLRNHGQRAAMSEAAKKLARPHAAAAIGQELWKLVYGETDSSTDSGVETRGKSSGNDTLIGSEGLRSDQ